VYSVVIVWVNCFNVLLLFIMAALCNRTGHYIFPCYFYLSTFTGSIASSARRRYLVYSDANFEVFRPARATRCTDEVKFGTGEGTEVPNFTLIGATTRV